MSTPIISSKATFVLLFIYLLCLASPPCVTCDRSPSSSSSKSLFSSSSFSEICTRDALALGVCTGVLGAAGVPPTTPCCALLTGVSDLEAATCLCNAIRSNIIGNNVDAPLTLGILLGVCQRRIPPGFTCARNEKVAKIGDSINLPQFKFP